MRDFLSENLSNIELQMNKSNTKNYKEMRKINQNTRTATVYTSDLGKRPKTQQSNQMTQSVAMPNRDTNADFSSYIQEESIKDKIKRKRSTLKS